MPSPTYPHTDNYAIRGGRAGRERLQILHQALTPTTLEFFNRANIGPGQRGLDLGCAGGAVSQDLARIVGPQGSVTGMDKDPENITAARVMAKVLGLFQLKYKLADLEAWEAESDQYDFVYARFLLTHLSDPAALIAKMYTTLRPGGRVLLEDIDFRGHFCHPDNDAFYHYVALYTEVVKRLGADPNIGPRLPQLVQAAGFREMRFQVVQPVFHRGAGKQMSSLTLENIADALVREKLADEATINNYLTALRTFEADRNSLISLPRIFQVWAVK